MSQSAISNQRKAKGVNSVKRESSFTLVELLATVAIIAVLSVIAGFFVVSYINWSQNLADQRTLLVLNDALTRYKCEGGSLTALTANAPIAHVMGALQTPINWNGYIHNVMQTGQTYPARSLYASGTGANYNFTAFNTYVGQPGGTSPAGLQWGGSVQQYSIAANTAASDTITLSSGVAAYNRLVLVRQIATAGESISSISDSRGNTWSIDKNQSAAGVSRTITLASGQISTPLLAGDIITITYGSTHARLIQYGSLFIINSATNVTAANGSLNYGPGSNTVSVSGNVTQSPSICFGVIDKVNSGTYSGSSWTQGATTQSAGSDLLYYVYKNLSSTGVNDPGGTASNSIGWVCNWAAYY